MENTKQGQIAEVGFIKACLEQGLIVSQPYGNSQHYDFIVDSGDSLYRTQIKSTKLFNPSKRGGRYKANCKTYGSTQYNENSLEIIAVYVYPTDDWYLIPIKAIRSVSLYLYPHRLNPDGYYEKYKDNWEVFHA